MPTIDGATRKANLKALVARRLELLKEVRAQRLLEKKTAIILFLIPSLVFLLFIGGLSELDSGLDASKQILGVATIGISELRSGNLGEAAASFQEARDQIRGSNEILLKILGGLPQEANPEVLLDASSKVVSALDLAIKGAAEFQNLRLVWDENTNSSSQEFYLKLKASREYFASSAKELETASDSLGGFGYQLLPGEMRGKFLEGVAQLESAKFLVEEVASLQSFVLNLFGGEAKTYLLIFQNNNEARATGGFIGTYGILKFANGQMQIEKIEGIYALDGQIIKQTAAPGPLQRQLTQHWGARDSNWFADFPTSARKILQFLESGSGILAEGVISFTPDVFEKLLALTGPIKMPEYGETLTSENFRQIVQYKTSVDYDRALNEPKKFLADFAPRFLAKLQDLDEIQWLQTLNILSQMLGEKQILMFSLDDEVQTQIVKYGADGAIKQTSGDYLGIFHSNVGGGKTDQNVLQTVEKQVSLDSGGLAIVRLKITRTHQGFEEKYFPKNLDYMRILVPPQAKLLSSSGFDDYALLPSTRLEALTDSDLASWDSQITRDENTRMYIGQEAGHKVFSNWLELLPGETKVVELIYEIQFSPSQTYTHILQKQAGSQLFEFRFELNYLPGNIAYVYPENVEFEGHRATSVEQINSDRFYGVIGE